MYDRTDGTGRFAKIDERVGCGLRSREGRSKSTRRNPILAIAVYRASV